MSDTDQESITLKNEYYLKLNEIKKSIYSAELRDKIVISVLDNGIGMTINEQNNLFKMFGCLQSTR